MTKPGYFRVFLFTLLAFFAMSGFGEPIVQFSNPRLDRAINKLPDQISGKRDLKYNLKELRRNCEQTRWLKSISVSLPEKREPFTYYYQLKPSKLDEPTLVFLPGGPGGDSIISKEFASAFYRFKDSFGANVLNIDPLGTGCNFGNADDFAYEQVSTMANVRVILEVLRKEKLDRIILQGQSYGTVMATTLASEMDRMGMGLEAVVLEAVLGKSGESMESYMLRFTQFANHFLEAHPVDARKLHQIVQKIPISPEFWGWKILNEIIHKISFEHDVEQLFNPEFLGHFSAAHALFDEQLTMESREEDAKLNPSYFVEKTVTCRELIQNFMKRWPIEFQNDQLRLDTVKLATAEGICNEEKRKTFYPFDSKDHQIHAPIIYFNGSDDPNTPVESAIYHFTSQSSAPQKFFYTIQGAAHESISKVLSTCEKDIWDHLLHRVYDLRTVLDENGACRK